MKKLTIVALIFFVAGAASAGMNGVLQAIAESEFEFQKGESDLPYPPFAWVHATRYRSIKLESDRPEFQGVPFDQNAFSHALFSPVYATERNIVMAGYYYGLNMFEFDGTGWDDGEVHLIGAGAAWLHQIKSDWMTAAFAAPLLHSNIRGGSPWETEWYVGGMARYYWEPDLQLFMGGVYIRSFGENLIYPYLGAIWLPHPRLSVAATMPWPSISYAFDRKTFVRVGAAPSGAQWTAKDNERVVPDYGGWDLGLSLERETAKRFWLGATVGWSGLRAFRINDSGKTDYGADLDGKPFVGLTLSFRP